MVEKILLTGATGFIQAGGVDTTGSLRTIQVKRNGEVVTVVDLYDYLLKGNLPKKIQLRDQDIVVIPTRRSTVEVDSAIVNLVADNTQICTNSSSIVNNKW